MTGFYSLVRGYFFGSVETKFFHWFRWIYAGALLGNYLFVLEKPIFFLSNFELSKISQSISFLLPLILWVFLILGFVFILLGFKTRYFSALTFFLMILAREYTQFGHFGWSFFALYISFFLSFIDVVDKYSLEHLWLKKPIKLTQAAWPFRGIEISLSLVYYTAMSGRVGNYYWESGAILPSLLSSRVFSRFSFFDLEPFMPALKAIGRLGYFAEWAGAFIFIAGRFKKFIALPLLGMHLSLNLILHVGPWQFLVTSILILILGSSYNYHTNTEFIKRQNAITIFCCFYIFLNFWVNFPVGIDRRFYWIAIREVRRVMYYSPSRLITLQTVMQTAPPEIICFKIYDHGNEKSNLLYETSPQDCISGRFRLFSDSMYQGLLRSYYSPPSEKKKHRFLSPDERNEISRKEENRISQNMGYAICRTFLKEEPKKISISLYQFDLQKKQLSPVSFNYVSLFDCENKDSYSLSSLEQSEQQRIRKLSANDIVQYNNYFLNQ